MTSIFLAQPLPALKKEAEMLESPTLQGTEDDLQAIVSKRLRPPVQEPARNWILPTTTWVVLEGGPVRGLPSDGCCPVGTLIADLERPWSWGPRLYEMLWKEREFCVWINQRNWGEVGAAEHSWCNSRKELPCWRNWKAGWMLASNREGRD